jgi:hypothetical protein
MTTRASVRSMYPLSCRSCGSACIGRRESAFTAFCPGPHAAESLRALLAT